nr:RNA-directed DNA polymerase, eukaryota, reverse transcriptase zinc-binding domain protein [Tanacetum cinerariifolium]
MGRLRLHANVARFQRPLLNKAQHVKGANVGYKYSVGVLSNSRLFSVGQPSYVGAVKNNGEHKQVAEMDSKPSLLLDESCILEYDYSLALKGKVSNFGLLTNLKTVLTKEGFENFNLKYLGGFWVLIEFYMKQLLEKFKSHVGVGSWFSSLEYASNFFVIDERVVWVDIKGVPMKIWTNNTFNKFSSKWGELLFEEDRKNMSLYKVSGWIPEFLEEDDEEDESDDDTLDNESDGEKNKEDLQAHYVNELMKINNDNKEEESSKATLKYPPGFTPDNVLRSKDVQDVVEEVQVLKHKSNVQVNFTKDNSFRGVTHSKEEDKESYCSGHFRSSEGLQTGGSILQVMEDLMDQELLNKRVNVMNSLYDLEKLEATEIAQKVKINWSIEGDENSKFFHGMLNKKRNQHAIRGILSEGNWIEDPNSVKNEFLSHFKERFDSPCSSRLILDGEFLNKLSADQNLDLDMNVTNESIKRAVWDYGTDKSPGPDGFTRKFFIGADLKEKKMSWFKWSRVLPFKDKGGLGVSSLFTLNRALLFKWMWRFHNDINALWSRFIRAVHGIDLLSYMKIKVGNDLNTKFWEDVWMGNKNFKTSFLRIYALESDKKHTVASKMIHNDVGFSLHRQPRDGVEIEQFRALTTAVEGVLLHDMIDRWKWSLKGSGEFSFASARKLIDDNRLLGPPQKTRWLKVVPIKINILA